MARRRARKTNETVTTGNPAVDAQLTGLRDCLDEQAGRYESLTGAQDVAAYLAGSPSRADEEILTEPILEALLRRVLGFPADAYFPQLGKGGLKPDFTPDDLIAHPFVFDAKASAESLHRHEAQIRRYMGQRSLRFGVLFNLREVKVFRLEDDGPDPSLSFPVLPLWQVARGGALPVGAEIEAFAAFCEQFSHRAMSVEAKIDHVRKQPTWSTRIARGDLLEVDVDFLVKQLRRLSRTLADDVAAQPDQLEAFLALNPRREQKILRELELLALDLSPGTELESLPRTLQDWRSSPDLPQRVWRQYCLRVAYLALTRILLYRAWEDVGFVAEYLYDGGFDGAYERLSGSVRAVLQEAFLHGAEKYRWLYGGDSNYDWYRPSDPALVDVLYFLAPVPLGRLDADVLGALYVSYVDEIDRDRLGQFFTPRDVVRFMLDRAGFSGPDGVFRVEGDTRRSLRIFDFATGSGGFLVEAARRIVDDAGIKLDDPREVREALAAVVTGFMGGEISPFPYYLTEVNLLLQVSRLVGPLVVAHEPPPPFVLGVVHTDSLAARSEGDRSFEEIERDLRADRAGVLRDERFDITLDAEKLNRYRTLLEDGGFDLVVGNPPYVTEANNKPLFERLRAIPAWQGTYRGKTDYLYYFLLLAVEKLAPGGRLAVITPAGWMNAGAADFLRAKLLEELRIDELFLFGSYRLFAPEPAATAPTPTVESAILVATKGRASVRHKLRVVALEDEAEAAQMLSGDAEARSPERDALLAEMERRARGKAGRKGGIHVHDVAQRTLRADRPWPVKHAAKDVAARVVAHLEALLEDEAVAVEPLAQSWKVFRGIETAADAYSPRVQQRLSVSVRRQLEAAGARTGDPIYELPPGAERKSPWREHPDFLARSPESRAILYASIDDADYVNLVRLTSRNPPPPLVLSAIERWRPVLASRAGFADFPNRPWWETHRARKAEDLRAPKVFALYRADRGRFALDESGAWQPSGKSTLVVGREPDAPVAYLCGLLNSELLDLWYAVRGKAPRDVWRNYEPKRMNEMPYRRPEGDPRADEIAELVRKTAATRRVLLPHRAVVRDLGRIVKDPWKAGPVEIDRAALVAELQPDETVSVRLDPELEIVGSGAGRLHREGPGLLVVKRASKEIARIEGSPERLDLLAEIIGDRTPDDLGGVLLPKDLTTFEGRVAERTKLCAGLLAEGRRLVEEVERLVCALYDVPAELTDEVVAHAVRRAGRAT